MDQNENQDGDSETGNHSKVLWEISVLLSIFSIPSDLPLLENKANMPVSVSSPLVLFLKTFCARIKISTSKMLDDNTEFGSVSGFITF